jgi:hypothetical protein
MVMSDHHYVAAAGEVLSVVCEQVMTLPPEKPPPCMYTMTGRLRVDAARPGVQTFNRRQSSPDCVKYARYKR